MNTPGSQIGQRRPPLALISLTLFVLLLPLTLTKPGLPPVLKADEAAYYLAALSLWHDGDLVCDDLDARRLFQEFAATDNLLLMSEGRGQPVYFSIPLAYPLLATPLVALFGANGMVLLNAALLMAMVWMGYAHLRRHNDEALSLLYTVGFFIFSTAFVYVFWLQAEVFSMACVMTAFFLIERAVDRPEQSADRPSTTQRMVIHATGAAALLAIVIYGKPMLVMLALPLLYRQFSVRSWQALIAFAAAGLLTSAALAGASYGLTRQAWPYFAPRAGISLSSPVDYIERRVEPRMPRQLPATAAGQITRGGKQLRVTMTTVARKAAPEFLFGRHGGFLVYMPFAVLSTLLFILGKPRSLYRWLILASAVLIAVLFVTVVRGQWLGGGGFIGNRYFSAAYPSFFFLVRRVRPAWLTALGYAAAAVFLGPLLITPLGALVSHPTIQAHVRNQPFPRLPLEWSLIDSLSGYRRLPQADITFYGRRDEIVAHGDEIWVRGAKRVEINLLSANESQGFVFAVRNLAPGNNIELCLQADCQMLGFDDVPAAGSKKRVRFEAQGGRRIPRAGANYRYLLTVTSEWGEQPRWRGSEDEHFYLGAALAFLGSPEELARDMYDVEWLEVGAPASIEAGSSTSVPIKLKNASPHTWPGGGGARVKIGYRWLSEAGEIVVRGARRTSLPGDIAANSYLETEVLVDAPETPGRYVLLVDLLRERVRWFSEKGRDVAYRATVDVVAPGPGSTQSSPSSTR